MQNLRLFICVDLPKEVFPEIKKIQESILSLVPEAKLVPLENLHVSLKFLGQVSKDKIEEITSRLESIEFSDLQVSLQDLGSFSSGKKVSLIWIKITGLENIQKKVDEALSELFPKEKRFMSHLTLARIKSTPSALADLKNVKYERKKFKIPMIKLKKSTLTPPHPAYTTLSLVQSKNAGNSINNSSLPSGPSSGHNNGSRARNTQ